MILVGREKEKLRLEDLVKSSKSEFVVLYGRRRVGKTFLIREYFQNSFSFSMTGIFDASLPQQLVNFHLAFSKYSKTKIDTPANWLEAFHLLSTYLEAETAQKKVIFIDELPWFDTPKSGFMSAFEHFWNHWASARKDILLLVCGSATSWISSKILKNRGGLHNRVSEKIKLNPFTLQETERFLEQKNINLNRHQIIELYMIMGGIPYYLETVKKGRSVAQNVDALFFEQDSMLKNEFENLYASLFKNYENHVLVVEALSKKAKGLDRNELLKATKIVDGGSFTRLLTELEESGFIRKYDYFGQTKRNALYQLVDFYTLFYFQFIKNNSVTSLWKNSIDSPRHRAWSGYAFELVCLLHIEKIKAGLGISGVLTEVSSWRSKISENGAQIDLLIDRRDQIITVCEMKYSINEFTIDKKYVEILRNKLGTFKTESATKKAVHLAMITTYGVVENANCLELVQNNLKMDILFD